MSTKTPEKTKTTLVPDVVQMLEAGVHFGHEKSKRNPRMEQYIYTHRNKVAIIDLVRTKEALEKAVAFVQEIVKKPNAEILFVGTKRQVRPIIQKYAELAGMPFVTRRWLGGTLTNFTTILKSIEKLQELKRTGDDKQLLRLTKKERAVRSKEIERLESVLEGMKNLKQLPVAIFVAGTYDERVAVQEAQRVGIPVIGITDTNADPKSVTVAIPANDDAIGSLDLITGVISKAISSARNI